MELLINYIQEALIKKDTKLDKSNYILDKIESHIQICDKDPKGYKFIQKWIKSNNINDITIVGIDEGTYHKLINEYLNIFITNKSYVELGLVILQDDSHLCITKTTNSSKTRWWVEKI